jgi:hypothetical protein
LLKGTVSKVANHDDKKNAFSQRCGIKINEERIPTILTVIAAMVASVI